MAIEVTILVQLWCFINFPSFSWKLMFLSDFSTFRAPCTKTYKILVILNAFQVPWEPKWWFSLNSTLFGGKSTFHPRIDISLLFSISHQNDPSPPIPAWPGARKHKFGVVFPCPNHCWAHGGARGAKSIKNPSTRRPVQNDCSCSIGIGIRWSGGGGGGNWVEMAPKGEK